VRCSCWQRATAPPASSPSWGCPSISRTQPASTRCVPLVRIECVSSVSLRARCPARLLLPYASIAPSSSAGVLSQQVLLWPDHGSAARQPLQPDVARPGPADGGCNMRAGSVVVCRRFGSGVAVSHARPCAVSGERVAALPAASHPRSAARVSGASWRALGACLRSVTVQRTCGSRLGAPTANRVTATALQPLAQHS